jgi:hypothetical protein
MKKNKRSDDDLTASSSERKTRICSGVGGAATELLISGLLTTLPLLIYA